MVLTLACRVDQHESNVCLRCRFFSLSSWPSAADFGVAVDAAHDTWSGQGGSNYFFLVLDVTWTHFVSAWTARVLYGLGSEDLFRLSGRRHCAVAANIFL